MQLYNGLTFLTQYFDAGGDKEQSLTTMVSSPSPASIPLGPVSACAWSQHLVLLLLWTTEQAFCTAEDTHFGVWLSPH